MSPQTRNLVRFAGSPHSCEQGETLVRARLQPWHRLLHNLGCPAKSWTTPPGPGQVAGTSTRRGTLGPTGSFPYLRAARATGRCPARPRSDPEAAPLPVFFSAAPRNHWLWTHQPGEAGPAGSREPGAGAPPRLPLTCPEPEARRRGRDSRVRLPKPSPPRSRADRNPRARPDAICRRTQATLTRRGMPGAGLAAGGGAKLLCPSLHRYVAAVPLWVSGVCVPPWLRGRWRQWGQISCSGPCPWQAAVPVNGAALSSPAAVGWGRARGA